ncbi:MULTISPECIES: hypothetical protein [Pantoea]|uniref:NIPSNAP protein n=1 Tax=Pantoea allii TaxID=574096 RepID=A0ABS6VL69_9GAMM|nr:MULTISPECIES: hypothetical protein [Pantoea]MBW1216389.1 hypothetical protein [Pantoea allii]MBW1259996.1 hypothetical protein [Pantoea allii]MBW1269096.1 hypothetical protein [Pantoea allii]MBW1291177.1 hypothetical protein [Pantoea allii]MDJ0042755.1 hypothetical protein [Pantoea allii]
MKQLRIYTLKDKASAVEYFRQCWPKHRVSLLKFGIEVDNVFLGGNDQQNQVMAVVTLPEGCHVQHLNEQYMRSQAFRDDMAGFPVANIIRVEEICISETLF